MTDSQDNVYISDSSDCCVRVVTASDGVINPYAGVCGCSVGSSSGDDGDALSAGLQQPYGLAVDSDDNLYIADVVANCVRKVNSATNVITTFAGVCDYVPPSDGAGVATRWRGGDGLDASAALLFCPVGLAFDSEGSLFISEDPWYWEPRIRKVDGATNVISTVANSMYRRARGLAVDSSDNLYAAGHDDGMVYKYSYVDDNDKDNDDDTMSGKLVATTAVAAVAGATAIGLGVYVLTMQNQVPKGSPVPTTEMTSAESAI